MRRLILGVVVLLVAIALLSAFLTSPLVRSGTVLGGGKSCALSYVEQISIPNAHGRLDHMDIDPQRQIFYVALPGNDSLAVVDLQSGKFVRSVSGLSEPQGVLYLPGRSLYVTNGRTGAVDIFNTTTLNLSKVLQLVSDADNIRYDSLSGLVWVGYGAGGITSINVSSSQVVGNVLLAGHPESFQIDALSHTIYANVPGAGYVAVIDSRNYSVLNRWALPNGSLGNFPMALDALNHRLFVGTRSPAQLLVYDTSSGKLQSTIQISGDPDDIAFDHAGCIYVTAGQGYVDVVRQIDANHYTLVGDVSTSAGARTSLLATEGSVLYVAVPGSNGTAAIYVYRAYGS